ncbi:jerky protein homolog-like [Cotesia glomerata]|uniref:jerky protein homolog-like n=1 Tax=Cotesia glomerata TaxID=32391 RepID=UPI001D0243AA|nr:jerky protein homolog-like [Cotesia glomerata]
MAPRLSKKNKMKSVSIDTDDTSTKPGTTDDNLSIKIQKKKTKRRSYSFAEKTKIIDELKNLTNDEVCKKYNLNPPVLYRWLKDSSKIKSCAAENYQGCLKKLRSPTSTELDNMLYTWFLNTRSSNVPISGPMIKQKAKEIAKDLNIVDFKASEGWLFGWKRRKAIRQLTISGEKLSADTDAASNHKQDFEKIRKEKNLNRKQIFNFDESALQLKILSTRTFVSNQENEAPGFKKDKTRVTIAACCNADGSCKLPLVVIGKSAKPRKLKNQSKDNLPVYYTHQKNSWMTAQLFKD